MFDKKRIEFIVLVFLMLVVSFICINIGSTLKDKAEAIKTDMKQYYELFIEDEPVPLGD